MSLPGLAARSGVSASGIWKIEKRANATTLHTAIALCAALGLSLDAACAPKGSTGPTAARAAGKGEI